MKFLFKNVYGKNAGLDREQMDYLDLNDFARLCDKWESMKLAEVVKMKMNVLGLTYTDLVKKLHRYNLSIFNPYGGVKEFKYEKVKANLRNQKPDEDLEKAVFEVLDIKDYEKEKLIAVAIKLDSENKSGRVAKKDQEKVKRLYTYFNENEGLLETLDAIIQGMREVDHFYNGTWVDDDEWLAIMQDLSDINDMKKFYMVMKQYPGAAFEFLQAFELEENDVEAMEKLNIQIS